MRCIGLVRVSTNEQAISGLGLAAQRLAIQDHATKLGLPLLAIHEDGGISGSAPIEERPGLLAAIADLQPSDLLLVSKRDRLGRDPLLVAMTERLVARKGARVVSCAGEGTEGDDPSSILMRRMIDAFAEFERLLIGARTKAALKAKVARGEPVGCAPYGFRWIEGRLELNADEQNVISMIRELRASGLKLREVETELRARGVVGRTGQPLSLPRISALLRRAA